MNVPMNVIIQGTIFPGSKTDFFVTKCPMVYIGTFFHMDYDSGFPGRLLVTSGFTVSYVMCNDY